MLHFENYDMLTIYVARTRNFFSEAVSGESSEVKSAAVFGSSENSSRECVGRFVNGEYVNN